MATAPSHMTLTAPHARPGLRRGWQAYWSRSVSSRDTGCNEESGQVGYAARIRSFCFGALLGVERPWRIAFSESLWIWGIFWARAEVSMCFRKGKRTQDTLKK